MGWEKYLVVASKITAPQKAGERHSVIMKQNGKDTGVCLKYSEASNFNTYVDVVFAPEKRHPSVVEKLTC